MDVAFKFAACYSNKQKRFVALEHCIQDILQLHTVKGNHKLSKSHSHVAYVLNSIYFSYGFLFFRSVAFLMSYFKTLGKGIRTSMTLATVYCFHF